MNWQAVGIMLSHELRMLMRYRRTVILAVVLPLLTAPLILLTVREMNRRRERRLAGVVYKYALKGSGAGHIRDLIARGKERLRQSPPREDEEGLSDFELEEVAVADPAAALQAREIHYYLEALSGEEVDALGPDAFRSEEEQGHTEGGETKESLLTEPSWLPGVPIVRIFYFADRQESGVGRSKMRALLLRERRAERDSLLVQAGFPANPEGVMAVRESDVASAAQVTGSYVGRFLTLVLMILMLSGGSVVAMDSIAGEKERGSLETLLTTAAGRGEIVAAKQLLILIVAGVITLIHLANVLLYVNLELIELPRDWAIEASPAVILTLLVLFLPFAAFVAGILLLISAYAKTYKEAQLYFFPVYLLSWLPALAGVLPGVSLRSAIVLVPVANVSVAVREIMVGRFDWVMIIITFAVMTAAALLVVRASTRMLTQERLITASEYEAGDLAGGASLFPRHVLRWYAVMGAVLFVAAANFPRLATFEGQIVFNELVLFLGASLLMILRYRLNVREALALRSVKPAVWLGVLLVIPAGALTAAGLFKLASLLIPVPERMLEEFARQLMPADLPLWLLLIYMVLVPGICEEISFRGTLLYGLHRRLRPGMLVITVGLIFGLFHVAIFRIVPTAFLGMSLTAIALLTGSIFPGMVAHAGNNALALLAGKGEVSLGRMEWWVYLCGVAGFALAFYIIYRNRTPYPGLRR